MRTIKFRGKCSISGDIVYGDLVHGVGWKSGNVYILPDKINLAYVKHCDPLDGVKANPDTVGQFTGLHDKNDKDVYEGDLLRSAEYGNSVFVVEFKHGAFVKTGEFFIGITSNPLIDGLARFEVIGNIHESKELL